MKHPKYLPNQEVVRYLTCPKCYLPLKGTLEFKDGYFLCKKCQRKYPVKNKIIQLINPDLLTKQVRNELKGNVIPLTQENIRRFATKDKWSRYYNHFVNQKISYLMGSLKEIGIDGIVSLGSGPGFEIKQILNRKSIPLIFSSDLAFSATRIVPHTLKGFGITLCLFTSDLNFVPVLRKRKFPILIYEALHHTQDSHKTLERVLKKKYDNIFLVEPCTNFLIKILAKLGLAQREEYSGLIPDFVDLSRVRRLADKNRYGITVNTIWEMPEDYVRKICRKATILETTLLLVIDLASKIGNWFSFGSFAIIHLYKI